MIKFLEHRIGDQRILRLIRKWLHAGIIEEGKWSETTEGSPQGAVTITAAFQCVPSLCV